MPMNYEQFKEHLTRHLQEQYPAPAYEINVRRITKNNGLHLDGLCIFKKGENVSPTIYLDSYYDRYVSGSNLADILGAIAHEYERGMRVAPPVNMVNHMTDAYYETVRSQIIMRLVNYEKNKEILEECPYIRFHDLAITFRWLAHWDEIGISTALITNSELLQWGIDCRQIYQDAVLNTGRIFPAEIHRLRDMIEERVLPDERNDVDLYVLTNTQGINGATCILYKNVLKDFAAVKNSNLYLLPSSIHEMMICPEQEGICENMLLSLVKEANHMVVTMGEVLSDNIYYYDYKKDSIRLIENVL